MKENTVWRRAAAACVVLTVFLAVACGSRGPVVIGNPEPAAGAVKNVTAGKLLMSFMVYMDNYVGIDAIFASKLNSTPLDGHVALLVRHDYGSFYVLVAEGLYEKEIAELKTEKPMRVYGRVGAAKLPTDASPKVAIIVDE
ncbi:MAG: hypothetical protein GX444_13700 [Myxococcales bacterium]|nr:hypothetical protein [Myxococcales bacterium]